MVELKNILKGLREQKQVSMDKMCQDLNNIYNVALAKSTISKWENGKAEPSLAYARILTKYFDVTLDYLLGLEKEDSYEFNKLSDDEAELLNNYNALDKDDKNKVIDYTKLLANQDKYKKSEEYVPETLAAHAEDNQDPEANERDLEKIKAIMAKKKKL